jgi:membrane-associated protease RseP (regulator of RpoE activity)
MSAVCGLIACFFAVEIIGCAPRPPREPKYIEDIRPIPPAIKVNSFTIQRRDLQASLLRLGEVPVRLVPIYQSVTSTESYEYRLFDVTPDSVYALLGLENSDIIVAADKFLIKNQAQFPAFMRLLQNENEATIEIRRGGEARLLKYTFVPTIQMR